MDKKADIPVTLLVIGTFVICSLALLTFSISNSSFNKALVGVHLNEKMNSKINEYNFYTIKDYSKSFIRDKLKEDNFYWVGNSFLINQSETKGFLFWKKEEFLFSCNYTIP